MNIRKGLIAEIHAGMVKLVSHSGYGALIESAPGKVSAVGTNHGERLVCQAAGIVSCVLKASGLPGDADRAASLTGTGSRQW